MLSIMKSTQSLSTSIEYNSQAALTIASILPIMQATLYGTNLLINIRDLSLNNILVCKKLILLPNKLKENSKKFVWSAKEINKTILELFSTIIQLKLNNTQERRFSFGIFPMPIIEVLFYLLVTLETLTSTLINILKIILKNLKLLAIQLTSIQEAMRWVMAQV